MKIWTGVVLSLILLSRCLAAQEAPPPSKGQLIYLPVYSHIYHGSIGRRSGEPGKVLLSAMISIRNTDPDHAIRVTSARYYDTNGRLLKEYMPTPRTVPAFGTFELFIEQQDESGGSGANFAIAWDADTAVDPPLVEAVHSTVEGARTLLFVTSGTPIRPAK